MMSAFFYLQPTLNRLFNNCIKVLLEKRLTLKSPALLGLYKKQQKLNWSITKNEILEAKRSYFENLDIQYLSVFSPNGGKYGPEKTPYLDTFQAVLNTIENFGAL